MTAISHKGSSQQRSAQLVMLCTVLCSLKFPAFIPDFKVTFCAISLIPHFSPSFCKLLFFLVFIFTSFGACLSSLLFSRCPSLFGKSSFWTVPFEVTMSVDWAIIFPVKGIYEKLGFSRVLKWLRHKIKFLRLWDLLGYFERTKSERPTCQKLTLWGKLSRRFYQSRFARMTPYISF